MITQTEIRPAEQNGVSIGGGLFATTAIRKGEDILIIEAPLVALVEEKQLSTICSGCFDTGQPGSIDADNSESVKACVRCHVVHYCGKKCQLKDWRAGHQQECPVYAKLYPRILPTNVRAILRILLRHKKEKITPEEYKSFLDLTFPPLPSSKDQAYLDMFLMSKATLEYGEFKDLDEEFVSTLFARLNANSFTLTSTFGKRRGIYLHPYTARFNHSCDYNAMYSFSNGKCYVKAIRPIQKDEQVFISYIDTTYSVNTRRKELLERYKFECQCSKCIHEIETTSKEEIEKRASAEQNGTESIDRILKEKGDNALGVAYGIAWKLSSLIRNLQENLDWSIIDTQQQPLAAIRSEIMAAKISAQLWLHAVVDAAIRHLRIDPAQFPDENHPTRREHAFEFAQCALYANEEMANIPRLSESDDIFVRHNVTLLFVAWSVLNWMVNGGDQESKKEIVWTNPDLEHEAARILQSINEQRDAMGITKTAWEDSVKENWEKMEVVVKETLEKERKNAW